MRKSFWFRGKWLRLAIISGLGLVCTTAVFAADASRTSFSALADSAVTRAEAEVTKVKLLVDQGALPHKRLDETQSALEDAKDEALLGRTLYGQLRVEALTPEQAKDMVAAAQRRVERQTKAVGERTKLLESGVLARSEMQPFEDELSMRQRTLELAENRAKLLEELMAMAKSEQALEQQSLSEPPSSQAVMIK